MENLKQVLDKLTKHKMFVHAIEDHDYLPTHVSMYDTHFIMKDSEIVHVGNIKTIEAFALRLK